MKQLLLAVVCVLPCAFNSAREYRNKPKVAATAFVNETSDHKTFIFVADAAQSDAIHVKDTSLTIGFRDKLTRTVIIITLQGENYVPAKGSFPLNEKGHPVCQGFIDLNGGSSADEFYGAGADIPQHVRPGSGMVTVTAVTGTDVKGRFSMTLYNAAAKKIIVNTGEFDCAIASPWKHPVNKARTTKSVSMSIHTQ